MKRWLGVLLAIVFCVGSASACYAGDAQELYRLSTGDAVFRQDNSVGIHFTATRAVLSTSIINGGYRDDLQGVFNHNSPDMVMTVEEYLVSMDKEAQRLGFTPAQVSSMGTGAKMDNVVIKTETFKEASVTAIVTAGVEGNAGRVGDPTDYYQPKQKRMMPKPGTINIMLVMNVDMPQGTLARALVTCTEAKTAALQELMVSSRYSNGLATGSGTDQTIVIANPHAPVYLDDTGKHSKLGELIGRAVKNAVKEALVKQNGLTPEKQHDVIRRIARFGITKERLYQEYQEAGNAPAGEDEFYQQLIHLAKDKTLVTQTSLYVHLLDQYQWGLLTGDEVEAAGNSLIRSTAAAYAVQAESIREATLPGFIHAWEQLLLACLRPQLLR